MRLTACWEKIYDCLNYDMINEKGRTNSNHSITCNVPAVLQRLELGNQFWLCLHVILFLVKCRIIAGKTAGEKGLRLLHTKRFKGLMKGV